MLSLINVTIFILWFASAVIDYSEFCYLWQLKQYRWDRMRDFFGTTQGRRYWLHYPLLWRSLIAIVASFWPFDQVIIIKYWLIAIFCLDILFAAYRIVRRSFRRPKITPKSLLVILTSMIVEAVIFLAADEWVVLFLLLIVRFFMASFAVGILYIPTRLWREWIIIKAKKKLRQYPNLIVIGITGSYGKTSTKEFLANILSKKFSVIKTIANQNNDYGIAKRILDSDLSKADVFIVEMGAYRVEDIDLYCSMVRPKIGILTAINEQHLSLFGNIKNTQRAKYALLRSLPNNGLAVTNSDNEYCREFLHEIATPVQTFGHKKEFTPTCAIEHVTSDINCTTAAYSVAGEHIQIKLPFPGEQYAENIAPCILVARHFGLSLAEIASACEVMPAPEQGRIITYGNAIIIDNSYNSNPAGFRASLKLLEKIGAGKKKIVITRGMLELGSESDSLHREIGREIARVADVCVIITPDFVKPLKEGIGHGQTRVLVAYTAGELLQYVEAQENKGVVILIENRIPESVKSSTGIYAGSPGL